MTKNQKNRYINLAKESQRLFPTAFEEKNLIYIGEGPINKNHFKCDIFDVHGTRMAGDSHLDYFIHKTDWIEIFGKCEQVFGDSTNVYDIQEFVKQAKQYIGKKVISTSGSNAGTSFEVKGVHVGFEEYPYITGLLTSQFFNKNGYFIWLIDKPFLDVSNSFKGMLFTPDQSYFKVVEQIFVTNHRGERYEAIDKGTVWKFGCASIDKELIKDSYNFLKKQEKYKGDRTIKKVTIGAADFDLETLEKLVNSK